MRTEVLKTKRRAVGMSIGQRSDFASDNASTISNNDNSSIETTINASNQNMEPYVDERARKLEARKQRNRASAEASRKRVRDQMERLEQQNEMLQDQVSYLQERLSLYEDEGTIRSSSSTQKKRKPITANVNTSFKLNSLEPAAFIEQPFRMALLAGV